MRRPPRPSDESVITGRMWRGILFNGMVMAASTLLMLDASLPGGIIEGHGDLRYAQTMAFTTLTLAQLFNVFNSRSDLRSAFDSLFSNKLLWAAIGLSLLLQVLVLELHPLQKAFGTTSLNARDWTLCLAAASLVLWLREIAKIFFRRVSRSSGSARGMLPDDFGVRRGNR